MNKCLTFLKEKVFNPAYNINQKYFGKYARISYCKKISNFIFNRSKETALIMLVFNSISIISSHLSQIGGLKRSKRENKDYLINQEWKELGLDLAFTIVPPFILNNFLMKKFDSGQWTTKSARNYLIDTIAPTVGASKNELYSLDHIKPFKESIVNTKDEIITTLKKSNKLPKFLDDKIKMPKVKPIKPAPMVALEDITTDFDIIKKGNFKPFYNGKAYDEINGQRNGLLILATIAYTVIASNIIMPILKNKLSNYSYKKQLEKQGETPESIKRKKRFSYNTHPVLDINENTTFSNFLTKNTSKETNKPVVSSTFDTFKKYTNPTQKPGLRI